MVYIYQLLVYADDVNILGGSVHTVKENTEALAVTSKETELAVNAEKTKYMVMSRDLNAGRSHSIKTDNISFEWVEGFKYLGSALTHPNFIQGEIKSRLKIGECLLSYGAESLSSCFLPKNLNIKICRTIILPVVVYGC